MPVRGPELLLPSTSAWRQWLATHNATHPAIWLVVAKAPAKAPAKASSKAVLKASPSATTGEPTESTSTELTYPSALDEALCYGWIDSGGGARDEATRYIRFGPRRGKSPWSRRNIASIERLNAAGQMAAPGLLAVEIAKANGLWDAGYAAGEIPEDLATEMDRVAVRDVWEGWSKGERYKVLVRLGGLGMGTKGRERAVGDVIARLKGQHVEGKGVEAKGNGKAVRSKSSSKASLTSRQPVPQAKGTRSSRRLAGRTVHSG